MPEVRIEEVKRFMVDCLRAVGTPETEAQAHAELLLHADVTGHFSHGLNRLELYINDIKNGATNPVAKPIILKESAATAWVDGCDALGATVGNFCMDLAIKKAKECGVGWVSVKRSNHFGMAGWWALKAERQDLIGLAFTNSSPVMVPTRSKESCVTQSADNPSKYTTLTEELCRLQLPVTVVEEAVLHNRALGTNPIAMFAPAADGDSLGVDMATTTTAMGKIEVQIHKNECIPDGWALGHGNETTTDAQLALNEGRLLPLGGFERTGGYKGYCLSAMIEVFCSCLSGSQLSHQIRSWILNSKEGHPPNLGQCFAAINLDCFAPGFVERVADCLKHWRSLEPVDPSLPVLAPGDKERINAEKTRQLGKIIYAQRQIDTCNAVAGTIGVKPLQLL